MDCFCWKKPNTPSQIPSVFQQGLVFQSKSENCSQDRINETPPQPHWLANIKDKGKFVVYDRNVCEKFVYIYHYILENIKKELKYVRERICITCVAWPITQCISFHVPMQGIKSSPVIYRQCLCGNYTIYFESITSRLGMSPNYRDEVNIHVQCVTFGESFRSRYDFQKGLGDK